MSLYCRKINRAKKCGDLGYTCLVLRGLAACFLGLWEVMLSCKKLYCSAGDITWRVIETTGRKIRIHLSLAFQSFPSKCKGVPDGSVVKNLPVNAGDAGFISGSRRSSGEGNCNPLLYCCLGNSVDREAWRASVYGVPKESYMT